MKTLLFLLLFISSVSYAQTNLRINAVSYNIHNGIGMDEKTDYERIARVINELHPDIVALQELDSITKRSNGKYVLGELAKLTNMHESYAAAIKYQGGSYGIGILSKEKPLHAQIIPMPGREEKRTMLIAEFPEYVFCATHQSLTPEDQVASVKLIQKALKEVKKPILFAGDMNAKPADKPQIELKKFLIPLNDTSSSTFPSDKPEDCIDYIYAYKNNKYRFNVEQRSVINESMASDHRPVQVIVNIEKK